MTTPKPKFYEPITLRESRALTFGAIFGGLLVAFITLDKAWSVWEAAVLVTLASILSYLWDIRTERKRKGGSAQ